MEAIALAALSERVEGVPERPGPCERRAFWIFLGVVHRGSVAELRREHNAVMA